MKKLTRACLDYMQTKKRQERERKDKRKNLTAAFLFECHCQDIIV